jgi:hypothetical protein
MSIRGQWWSFVESMVQMDRYVPGVYELRDVAGTVVYIGSSHEVRKRLGSWTAVKPQRPRCCSSHGARGVAHAEGRLPCS